MKRFFSGVLLDVLVRSKTELLMFEKPCDAVVNVCRFLFVLYV